MTKFILHGGSAEEINADNDNFFREITLGKQKEMRILLNYFSRKDDEIEKCAERDKGRFLKNSDNKNLIFEVANPTILNKQLQRCDAMYMKGGETKKLVKLMRQTADIEQLFKDKIIAGSSAGVYALTKYYWENDEDIIEDGLGIFNIKAYCHYKPEDIEKIKLLSEYKEKLPILILPNYKWVVSFE